MDIESRIDRRRRRDREPRLIQDYDALSPVFHVEEPADRGPVLERLLDHLDPVFDGQVPGNAYVHGPAGAGKSAVVTALFAHLQGLSTETQAIIHTSTRAQASTSPAFVYLDARETTSEFAFYHALLSALVDEQVPKHGIGTGTLTDRLRKQVLKSNGGVVVAVDHVDEPASLTGEEVHELLSALPGDIGWLAVGKPAPEESALSRYTEVAIPVQSYKKQMLVDVLMARTSDGLAQRAFDHALASRVATWADGNAHDALAVVFLAADRADRDGRRRLTDADIDAATAEIPDPCIPLGSVRSLPENRQAVLRELVDLDESDRASVTATTEAIGASQRVDLSPGTVKRFLYEMAESGIVRRIESPVQSGQGRPPSRVEPQFPPTLFRRLYDLAR